MKSTILCALAFLPMVVFSQAVTLTSANFSTYAQPLENQRLSTGNGATFSALTTNVNGRITVNKPGDSPLGSSILLSSPTSYPGIVFNEGDGAGNLLKRWDLIAASGSFKIRDNNNNADRFFIDGSNGFVGIGTSAPTYRLHVLGTGNFSGALMQGGNQVWHAGNLTPARGNNFYTSGVNMNDYMENGLYMYDGIGAPILNAPTTVANFRVISIGQAHRWTQMAFHASEDRVFFRRKYDATFQSWREFWHSGNFTPANFVATSGGNITGDITIGTTDAQKSLYVNGIIQTRRVKVTTTGWADYVFDSTYQLPALATVETYIQKNKRLPDVPSAEAVAKEGVDVGDNQVLLLKKIEELTLYIIQQNKDMEVMKKRMAEFEQKVK